MQASNFSLRRREGGGGWGQWGVEGAKERCGARRRAKRGVKVGKKEKKKEKKKRKKKKGGDKKGWG